MGIPSYSEKTIKVGKRTFGASLIGPSTGCTRWGLTFTKQPTVIVSLAGYRLAAGQVSDY